MSASDPLRTFTIGRILALMLRAAIPILCVLTLSGCSYSYGVQAKFSDGRLIFDANPQWGADCVRRVEVSADDDERPEAMGTVWEQAISHEDRCQNTFPIIYGEPLKGKPHVYDSGGVPQELRGRPASSVSPRPLHIGVLYTVDTTTGATGYGCGRFRILPNRRVENLGCS